MSGNERGEQISPFSLQVSSLCAVRLSLMQSDLCGREAGTKKPKRVGGEFRRLEEGSSPVELDLRVSRDEGTGNDNCDHDQSKFHKDLSRQTAECMLTRLHPENKGTNVPCSKEPLQDPSPNRLMLRRETRLIADRHGRLTRSQNLWISKSAAEVIIAEDLGGEGLE